MNVKILVFSDSHGSKDRVRRVCDMHKDADYILHAGDGVHDLSFVKDTGAKRICVCGNCDFFANDISDEEHIRIEGYSFYVCHGDAHGVKSSDCTGACQCHAEKCVCIIAVGSRDKHKAKGYHKAD